MKKILFLLVIALVCYAIYFDITKGTLPAFTAPQNPIETKGNESALPYKVIAVQAGDTVLSILEREEGHLSKPIETIMKDFEELNNGVSPLEIQIGKTYKFPTYMKPSQ
ncbi:hypothetical protein [Bacillus massiliigorillae]|uniref:hypothetical protein n=1 Tax=Bacillus massiliigorillae TaxID=1243664 RepID=UPI000399EC4B|nr:hypothetical protein [Bacillus massiliigorillae]